MLQAELLRFYAGPDEVVFRRHCQLDDSEIASACSTGRGSADRLRSLNPLRNAEEIALANGCTIVSDSWQVAEGRIIYLGESSRRPPLIRINSAAVRSVARLISDCDGESNGECFDEAKVAHVVIAHELFHLLEPASPSMEVELRAHAFARALTRFPFSPLLFDALLSRARVEE